MSLLLVHAKGFTYLVDLFLEFADASEGDKVSEAVHDDGKADEGGKCLGGGVRVLESENAENSGHDAEYQDAPPIGEACLLVVEALYGYQYSLDKNPHHEDDGKRDGEEKIVAEEDDTDQNLKDGGKHACAAVGQECLCFAGEYQFRDTGEEGETSDCPCCCKQRSGRMADAHDAEGHQQDSRDGKPNFGA